jgi:serine/threonine-protein kinase CLA4
MPEAWQKLLTKSAITREDYAKDPQAVLDVLEFYTDHQKREMEEMGLYSVARSGSSGGSASLSPSSIPTYPTPSSSAPRFNAGTGLGGAGLGKISTDSRPSIRRQESTSNGLNGESESRGSPNNLSQNAALARAVEVVSGSHAQHTTIASHPSSGTRTALPSLPSGPPGGSTLQASRPAPPRPLLTANRNPPPPPSQKALLSEHTPSSADLRARAKAHGPHTEPAAKPPGLRTESPPTHKESSAAGKEYDRDIDRERDREREKEKEKHVKAPVTPSKPSPAASQPADQYSQGTSGIPTVHPVVKPLQPVKKTYGPPSPAPPAVTITEAEDESHGGGVAAAAAALEKEKPKEKEKEKEKRISTMTEAQIMEKLRTVVSQDDPKTLYSKIRKVGQG